MAKVRSNEVLDGLSGKLGKQIMLRRLADGRTIVCAQPDFSRRKLSAEQKLHHQRFREASAWARGAAKTQPVYAERAAGTLKTAYNIALGDWFNPPEVHAVDAQGWLAQAGGKIRVQASDDVLVAGVDVVIFDAAGNERERTAAAQRTKQEWVCAPGHRPQAGDRLVVEARDLPGNVSRIETPIP